MMTKNNLGVVLLGGLGLVGACGSNSEPVTTPAGCANPRGAGCEISVNDGSFVHWVAPVTDGTSSAVVTYTPGKYCLSGTADPGPNGAGWGAILVVTLADTDASDSVVAPFDAAALGVTQVRFTVDPPLQGVLPEVTQITSADCTQLSTCLTSFSLDAAVTTPGTVTAQLTDFTQPDGTHSNTSLDQTLIVALQFYVPTLPDMAAPYDFCVQDLTLLDATGKELQP